jgi:hypothetical protein
MPAMVITLGSRFIARMRHTCSQIYLRDNVCCDTILLPLLLLLLLPLIQAMKELADVVGSIKPDKFDSKVVRQTDDYLYAEFQSPTFGVSAEIGSTNCSACPARVVPGHAAASHS